MPGRRAAALVSRGWGRNSPGMSRQAFLLRLHKYISRGPSSSYGNLNVFTCPPGRLSPDPGWPWRSQPQPLSLVPGWLPLPASLSTADSSLVGPSQSEVFFACMCALWLSCVRLFVTPQTVARQDPLSLGFSRQEHWSVLWFQVKITHNIEVCFWALLSVLISPVSLGSELDLWLL